MRPLPERDVARLLRRRPDPRPPAHLAQRIKDEIPARIVVGEGALRHHPDRDHAIAHRQLVVLGGFLLALVAVALWGLRALLADREDAGRQAELDRLLAASAAPQPLPDGWLDAAADQSTALPLRVDTGSYARARSLLLAGRLPAPESVSGAAFVAALDYGDPAPLKGELAIFTEGAAAPGAATRRLVRVTLRAAGAPPTPRSGIPAPIALGVSARLAVDPAAVARWRLVGGASTASVDGAPPGEDLRPGHRVTVLVELDLRPGVPPDRTMLTVSAAWRRRSGAAVTLSHAMVARDAAGPWSAAPASLQLAALAADLAAALSRAPDPAAHAALARAAAALAARHPTDPAIAELARITRALRPAG